MPDIYSNLPPEVVLQQQQLNRQQKMAEMLLAQGAQPQAAGQMVSGRYVPNSFFQNLQPVANMLVGAYMAKKGDEKALDLAEQLRKGRAEAEERIIKNITPQTQTTEMAGPYTSNIPMPTMQTTVPPNYEAALREIRTNPYGAGKEYLPSILKNVIPEPIKPTTEMQNYEYAKSQGYKGTLNDFRNQITPYQQEQLRLDREKFEFEKSKEGTKPLTETQANATAFGMRATEANQIVTDLEKKGFTNTGVVRTAVAGTMGQAPIVGDKLEQGVRAAFNVLPEVVGGPSSEQQQVDQARRNFISAVLRKESGAVIGPNEYRDEERKYFPQAGDSDAVIKQKQQARILAIKALEAQAGPQGKKQIELSAGRSQLSSQDQEALNWANANPNDPRSAQIKQRLGR